MTGVGGAGEDGRGHDGAVNVPPPHPSRLDPDRPDYGAILEAHRRAVEAGEPGYLDPSTGLFVLTAASLLDRGSCCEQGCRHCPYLPR